MTTLREALLTVTPVVADDLCAWWAGFVHDASAPTVERALLAGARADRLGFAFAGGYAAALAALVPALGDLTTCLCATEEGGNHPRAIRAQLSPRAERWVLDGEKRWATLGGLAEQALVVASVGEEAGRNRLRVARVSLSAPGVVVSPMPETPFVPEVPHASVSFRGVEVAELLPGDGYARYLKPFRSVEDLHVHAALLGYLIGVARRSGWPSAAVEELLALAGAAQDLAAADPLSPATHLALAGLLSLSSARVEACQSLWARVDPAEAARWQRDRPLLEVAGKARAARLAKARAHFGLQG